VADFRYPAADTIEALRCHIAVSNLTYRLKR
jgi:hypothetical protein